MFPLTALLEVGGKLIDKLIPDPEAKARAQAELIKMQQEGELAKMANDTKLFEVELDYILTDVELNQLGQEIIWCIQETTLIEDMQHPEDDFDEDAWRYDV